MLGPKLYSKRDKTAHVDSSIGPEFAVVRGCKNLICSCNLLQQTAVLSWRKASAAARIIKLLIYWRHTKWLGDTEHVPVLLTMLSSVLCSKVLKKEGETWRESLLATVLSPVLSFAFYSCFASSAPATNFLAVLVRPFTCTLAPKGCKPCTGLTFCRRVSGGHNQSVWWNTMIFIPLTHSVHTILIVF